MLTNRRATTEDYEKVLEIWERSVRKTHYFLEESDLMFYRSQIPNYLSQVELLLWSDQEQVIGFSGHSEKDLDMLFLDPNYIGKRYGHLILTWLINHKQITKIDVNEQNEKAKDFYLSHGFSVISRSETDGFGKAYPILHLERTIN